MYVLKSVFFCLLFLLSQHIAREVLSTTSHNLNKSAFPEQTKSHKKIIKLNIKQNTASKRKHSESESILVKLCQLWLKQTKENTQDETEIKKE